MTQKCNLQCTYCGASEEPEIMPINLDYPISSLRRFFVSDNPVIAFYGGEPLINVDKIKEVMDNIPARAFVIQTNGTLLHRLPKAYLQKLHTILISIDGSTQHTDAFRGYRTSEKAMKGARYTRSQGFVGDMVARMTIPVGTDIFKEVIYLLEKEEFDHVHWQLDVMWDIPKNGRISAFKEWRDESYNPGISKLVKYWISQIQEGVVLGLVPFLGIMYSLLTKKPAGLRCKAGTEFFSITTDGRITFCPILPSVEFPPLGNIFDDRPSNLVGKVGLDEPCISCNEVSVCGGRCLYTNLSKYWGDEGFGEVCISVFHLIDQLRAQVPIIRKMIEKGILELSDFRYPKIENGVEIIP